jgi:hypothetical protein
MWTKTTRKMPMAKLRTRWRRMPSKWRGSRLGCVP